MGDKRFSSLWTSSLIFFYDGSVPKLLLFAAARHLARRAGDTLQGSEQGLNTDPVDLDKFRQDSLAAHNSYRAKHGVAALKISAELNALAQEWAEKLIAE